MLEFLDKFWLLGLVAGLFILLLAAFNFAEIAKTKGHSYGKYFAWCFFAGLIGWIMVIALPERADKVQTDLAEAEKAETIKVVRILTIVIVVIALIVWIGVSVNNAREKAQEDKIKRIEFLEETIDEYQNKLNQLNYVSPRDRTTQWENDRKAYKGMIEACEEQLKELKKDN